MTFNLLLETGDELLHEGGGNLLLEGGDSTLAIPTRTALGLAVGSEVIDTGLAIGSEAANGASN
jgi:hypothetical protein